MTPGHDFARPSLEASDRSSTSRGTPAKANPPPNGPEQDGAEKKKPWLEKWLENEEDEAFNLPFTD